MAHTRLVCEKHEVLSITEEAGEQKRERRRKGGREDWYSRPVIPAARKTKAEGSQTQGQLTTMSISGRALALHVKGPEFNPESHKNHSVNLLQMFIVLNRDY